MKIAPWLVRGWVAFGPLGASGQEAATFHGSEAFRDFRRAGCEMLDEQMFDLNQDGRLDAVVVEKSEEGIGLSAWRAEVGGGYHLVFRSEKVPASSVAWFGQLPLGKSDSAFMLNVYEDNPDEADHWVRVFVVRDPGLALVFESEYQLIHSEEDAGRPPTRVMNLGGVGVGIELREVPEGWPEILVRHDPRTVSFAGRRGVRTELVLGMGERAYRAEGGSYREAADGYLDFLPQIPPAKVTATSNIQSGTNQWEASRVADKIPTSGWVEGRPDAGEGESVTLSFDRPAGIRLVRLIPGCAGSAESWNRHNRVRRFDLGFENGVSVSVDRGARTEIDPRLEAWGDYSISKTVFGEQTLIFFSEPLVSRWMKVTIRGVERGSGEENETCISEISVHQVRVAARSPR